MKGGAGVAENAINVFGGIGQQRAVAPNDNTIAMKQMGGKKGGSMGVDIGAPFLLAGLNQYMKRRSSVKKGGKKGKSKKMMKKGKWGGKRRRSAKKVMGGGDKKIYYVNEDTKEVKLIDEGVAQPEGFIILTDDHENDPVIKENMDKADNLISGGNKQNGGRRCCGNGYKYNALMYCDSGDMPCY
jgi:hypothetical protein